MNNNYVSKARDIANTAANSLGLIIEEIEWVKESGTYILRIIGDKESGLFTLDDCTKLNELISDALDREDFIKEEYMLEVSSAGAEKVLKSKEEIIKNINNYVHIDFNNPVSILKDIRIHDIEGTLLNVLDDSLELNVNLKGRMKKITIENSNIKLIRKAIKF